jgi:hypothetical protein
MSRQDQAAMINFAAIHSQLHSLGNTQLQQCSLSNGKYQIIPYLLTTVYTDIVFKEYYFFVQLPI